MSKAKAERKIYGINACQSFYQRFPERIIRAWITEEAAKISFGPLMKFLAQEKRAYHLADEAELERVTDSSHHEGVCLLVQELPVFTPEGWLAGLKPGKPLCVLALDGVSNPHNLGAIMRVAAHFGVSAILTTNPQALRSGSAIRTAEGGATHVMVMGTENLVKTLNLLKKNEFTVLATSSHESRSLYDAPLPTRLVLVMGEEQTGVSKAVLQVVDGRIVIAGTSWVESLNVSVATGVLLSEFWRQHRIPRREPAPDAAPATTTAEAPRRAAGARPGGGGRQERRPGERTRKSGPRPAGGKSSGRSSGKSSGKPTGKSPGGKPAGKSGFKAKSATGKKPGGKPKRG